jgi:hypothetical protein
MLLESLPILCLHTILSERRTFRALPTLDGSGPRRPASPFRRLPHPGSKCYLSTSSPGTTSSGSASVWRSKRVHRRKCKCSAMAVRASASMGSTSSCATRRRSSMKPGNASVGRPSHPLGSGPPSTSSSAASGPREPRCSTFASPPIWPTNRSPMKSIVRPSACERDRSPSRRRGSRTRARRGRRSQGKRELLLIPQGCELRRRLRQRPDLVGIAFHGGGEFGERLRRVPLRC